MKKLIVLLIVITGCADFDYVEPTEETVYRPIPKDTADVIIVADTTRRKCGVGL